MQAWSFPGKICPSGTSPTFSGSIVQVMGSNPVLRLRCDQDAVIYFSSILSLVFAVQTRHECNLVSCAAAWSRGGSGGGGGGLHSQRESCDA